jgi:uncharacterized protein (DUF1501 family)
MSLTRRQFLYTTTALSLGAASSASDRSGTVLVVLQLAGGNDGLNTVVPYEDDHCGRARTTLRLTGSQVHKIGSSLGLHPEMNGFARLFAEGRLAILQGVGYPKMLRDHNTGMRAWQTASLSAQEQTGWIGRIADRDPESIPAAYVGTIAPPFSIHAREAIVPQLHSAADWAFAGNPPEPSAAQRPDALASFAARTTADAFAKVRNVSEALRRPAVIQYPQLPLAQSLQSVAQLIRADLGIRIFLVEQGGVSPGEFDNHANQAVNHAVSLRELSASVTAFCDDIEKDRLSDRVLLMTYSEFGRTLTENGRHGTGHGAAAPVFLAGGAIRPGLIGNHPSLTDLDADAPKPHTDFRSLYAAVLDDWLSIPADPILGGHFEKVSILGTRSEPPRARIAAND